MEIRAGPRFALSPGNVNGVTVKPYVVTTGALLADVAYMGGIGGGQDGRRHLCWRLVRCRGGRLSGSGGNGEAD